jgi:hypothetical protein
MELLDQARLAQARFADDQHQLSVALPSPLPAPHQRRHFVFAANERGKLPALRAAAAAARPNEPIERRRLGHALEGVGAALLGDKEPGDLALHPRGDQYRAGLGQRLHAGRDIRHVAVNLARRIHHRGAGVEPDAGGKLRLASAGILAIELRKRALDRNRGARRALSVVLLRYRIAEQRQNAVAELLGDMAAHLGDRR